VKERQKKNKFEPAFIFASVAAVLTLVGTLCAITGLAILPKCRYGEAECYFHVSLPAYNGGSEIEVLKLRAIEGGSDYSAEQLAIPILAVCLAAVPAGLTFFGTLFNQALGLLETSKIFLATNLVFLILGIRSIQSLTFDCRWWGDHHHQNSKACHDGFNLYIAATAFLVAAHLCVLIVSVRFVENQRYEMGKKHEVVSLTMGDEEQEAMSNL